jgi:3-isopropylmalate/(R)-2-methylmalate dehydratase small subunit
MLLKGRALRLKQNDNINTDYIISGRYKFHIQDLRELAKHIFEDIEPGFADKVREGDIIVAGKNFGMGSSREQAPLALRSAGISLILAKSFARIFYRNAFNLGLPLLQCDTEDIKDLDQIEIDLGSGDIKDITSGFEIKAKPIPDFMRKILEAGGIIEYLNLHKGFDA